MNIFLGNLASTHELRVDRLKIYASAVFAGCALGALAAEPPSQFSQLLLLTSIVGWLVLTAAVVWRTNSTRKSRSIHARHALSAIVVSMFLSGALLLGYQHILAIAPTTLKPTALFELGALFIAVVGGMTAGVSMLDAEPKKHRIGRHTTVFSLLALITGAAGVLVF